MKFRNLDENNDWTFGKGLNNYARDNKAIGLNIKTRIKSWVGDCFFDTGAGIDWINRLGSKDQRELLELDLRNIILQTEGVASILEFSTNLENRNFTADYSVQTIYSESYTDSVEVTV